MLMIDSIEFDVRDPFFDVKAEVPCFPNDKTNEKKYCKSKHYTFAIASQKKNLSWLDEEKLAELVRNYTHFYDKSHHSYEYLVSRCYLFAFFSIASAF